MDESTLTEVLQTVATAIIAVVTYFWGKRNGKKKRLRNY